MGRKEDEVEAEEEKKRQQEYQQHEMQLFPMLARTLNNPPRLQPQEEFPQYSIPMTIGSYTVIFYRYIHVQSYYITYALYTF